jgi:hypothetical protein
MITIEHHQFKTSHKLFFRTPKGFGGKDHLWIAEYKTKETLGYPITNTPPANGEIVMFPSSRGSVAALPRAL